MVAKGKVVLGGELEVDEEAGKAGLEEIEPAAA